MPAVEVWKSLTKAWSLLAMQSWAEATVPAVWHKKAQDSRQFAVVKRHEKAVNTSSRSIADQPAGKPKGIQEPQICILHSANGIESVQSTEKDGNHPSI
jgi:hypothetical protein